MINNRQKEQVIRYKIKQVASEGKNTVSIVEISWKEFKPITD